MIRRKDIQRTLIENTLRLHLHRYDSDSDRVLRRLIDIGTSVSKTPGQSAIFKKISSLFNDSNSLYYPALKKEFDNVNRDHFVHFCTNLGYLSWKRGPKELSDYNKTSAKKLSWLQESEVSSENIKDIDCNSLDKSISSFNQKGVYAFNYKIKDESVAESFISLLIPVINTYKDSDFMIILPDLILDDETIDQLSLIPNLLISIAWGADNSDAMSEILSEKKILYSFHYYYGKDDSSPDGYTILEDVFDSLSQQNTSLVFMLPAKGLTDKEKASVHKKILRYRSGSYYPLLITDYYFDVERINKLIYSQ